MMINGAADMTHLAVLDAHARELQGMLIEFNGYANGVTDKAELCALRLRQIAVLREVLHRHKRALDHMAGNPIEPEAQFGEAIVHAVMGGA
jgi:hypothetical protein